MAFFRFSVSIVCSCFLLFSFPTFASNFNDDCEDSSFKPKKAHDSNEAYHIIVRHHKKMTSESFSNQIINLYKLIKKEKDRLSKDQFDNLIRISMPRLNDLSSEGLILLFEFTKSRIKHTGSNFLHLWQAAVLQKLNSMNIVQLTQLIDALKTNRSATYSKLIKAILTRISNSRLLDTTNPEQFTLLTRELADSQIQPSDFLNSQFQSYIGQNLPLFTAEQLTHNFLNMSSFRKPISERLYALWLKTVLESNDLKFTTLSHSMRVLYLLNKLNEPEALKIAEKIRSFKHRSDEKRNNLRKSDFNLILVELYARKVLKRFDLNVAEIDENNPISFGTNNYSTELERTVEAQLKLQGLTRAEADEPSTQQDNVYYVEWVTESGVPVDFYVPSKKLIIQVDGPSHFMIDSDGVLTKTYRLSDIRIDELFKAYGYEVLRIHYDQVEN